MNNKKRQYSFNSKAFLVGAIVIVLLFNGILISLNNKISLELDFTKGKIFALSDASKTVVDKIDEETQVLVLSTGTESETLSMVTNVLDKYSQRNSLIKVRQVDVVKNPAEIKAYAVEFDKMGLEPIGSLLIKQGDRHAIVNAADYFSDAGYSYIERMITNKLATLVDQKEPSGVFFSVGHGEQISSTTVNIIETAGYTYTQVDLLSQGFPESDEDIVIISSPQIDFSPEEINALDSYLDRGGNVQIYFDPIYGAGRLPNLHDYLKEDWGLIVENHVVVDAGNMIDGQGFMLATPGDHVLINPVKESQKRVGYGPANSFSISRDAFSEIIATPVLSSSDTAYAKESIKKMEEQGTLQQVSGDVPGTYDLMVVAERTTVDNKGENETIGQLLVSGSLLIFASIATDSRFANEDVLLNSLSWMQGGETTIMVPMKKIPGGEMVLSVNQYWTWFVILVAIVPVIILAAGIFVFVKRRYR